MKTFLITEDEKKRILNMHKTRTANHYLNEQSSSGTRPPINEYKELIGKSVIFSFNRMNKVTSKVSPGDVWTNEELLKTLDFDDKEVFQDIIKKPIRGRIKEVRGLSMTGGAYVIISLDNLNNELGFGIGGTQNEVSYTCGKGLFDVDLDIRQGVFFADKMVNAYYSCESLSNFLEKKLPCGNFDFSMNDNDSLPGTLS